MDSEKCAIKYKTAVSTSSNATQSHDTELSMKRSCWYVQTSDYFRAHPYSHCFRSLPFLSSLSHFSLFSALREFVHCKYEHVGLDCGARAELFMKNHLGQITNPIMERHCTAYVHGSEACLALSGSAQTASNSMVRRSPAAMQVSIVFVSITLLAGCMSFY